LGGTLDGAISGFAKIITVGVDSVLGNSSMGQSERTNMFGQKMYFSRHLDAYFTAGTLPPVKSLKMVRDRSLKGYHVIDLDPQVLTWAFSK